jgi:hypothetical protein
MAGGIVAIHAGTVAGDTAAAGGAGTAAEGCGEAS